MDSKAKMRIAHLSGPNATIQNTPPLVTSNKARLKHGLETLRGFDGVPLKHDSLRAQRLAAQRDARDAFATRLPRRASRKENGEAGLGPVLSDR
jgi:hypothetical protein